MKFSPILGDSNNAAKVWVNFEVFPLWCIVWVANIMTPVVKVLVCGTHFFH